MSVVGPTKQKFQSIFAQVTAKAADLRGVAWQAVLVIGHAAEELPHDVLAPAQHQFLIAEVETVLEVQQAGHQANGQLGTASVAATRAHQDLRGAEHVTAFKHLAGSFLALEFRSN